MSETINYFVVTRNRPNLLRKCLLSLAAGHECYLSQLGGKIFVVDDSSSSSYRCLVSATCRHKGPLPVVYLGQASYVSSLDKIERRTRLKPHSLQALVGSLGSPGWNVHAARNFAWLFARSYLPETSLLCFLDDDVRLTSESYLGHCYRPDALSIISDNVNLLRSSLPVALGSSFLGRQDVTLSRHLETSSRQLLRSGSPRLSDLNHGFPLSVATRARHIDRFDNIPSTGFLVTNHAAIACAHLSGFYNEDWLWARLLSYEPHGKIARLKPAALHVGPMRPYSRATILFQEMGEILYDALTDSLAQKPKDEEASRFVRRHLDGTVLESAVKYHVGVLGRRLRTISKAVAIFDHSRDRRFTRAKTSLGSCASGIGNTIQRLKAGEYRTYLAPFHAYLDQISVWRRIVPR